MDKGRRRDILWCGSEISRYSAANKEQEGNRNCSHHKNGPERPLPRRLLLRRRVLQHRANLGCSRRADASTPSAATTSGSRGGSSTGSAPRNVDRGSIRRRNSASASSSADITTGAAADQIDRLLAVAIDEIWIGSLLQKVTNQVRPACLHRFVESRR